MRSRMRLSICLIALGALLCTAAAASASRAQSATPIVKLARLAPLVVSGSGFGRDAVVRVTVTTNSRELVRTVRASSSGDIRVRFSGSSLTVYACRGTSIAAVARNGLDAGWRPGSKSCLAIAVPIAATG